jgi:nucleotide-binding universal stress UspA family protein
MDPSESTYAYRGSRWIKRIVVAADGSPASSRGLEQVADLAPRVGAKVVVVYVRHLPATALMAPGIADSTMVQSLDEQEAGVRQEALRALGRTGIEWEVVVRAGSPGEEIVQVADESGADLVVVGSNRHSSLHNLFLGSTAAYLAAHSQAPVLVMRSRAAGNGLSAEPATSEAIR